MPLTKTLPVPEEPISEESSTDQRLWIGNLDTRITEYYLLKILQKYGKIEKFDMLFHRSGPLAGQPRGYAFVSYTSKDTAENVRESLNGKKIGSKYVAVRWAHSMTKDEMKRPIEFCQIPALTGAKTEKKVSRMTAIQAIEAKLKMMEHTSDSDFKVKINPGTSLETAPPQINHKTLVTNINKDRHKDKPYRKPR